MIITLENKFHNTEVNIRVNAKKDGEEFTISRATQLRIKKALCPHNGNQCSCNPMIHSTGKFDYQVVNEDYNRNQTCRLIEKY